MSAHRAHERAAGGEDGVTLVEVIVYAVIAGLLALVVASLFAAGLASQAHTRERDTATGGAQVVSESIRSSIRNADAFRVDGAVLRARVATGATGWECRAWALTPAGDLRYRASPGPIPEGTAAEWTVLASGVSGTLAHGAPFREDGGRLELGIVVASGSASVPVAGSISPRAKSEGADGCW